MMLKRIDRTLWPPIVIVGGVFVTWVAMVITFLTSKHVL